ncbi:LPS export ABC transporter permease LptG [Coxiella endosymbiont of Ornithodoros amblus]|uniref:LPS export ABC transporter permease LptG n=1 Tax=Coxiella endosymbiont of Ornithodoros amblus TaxID=1656166 RepID=UPI00244DB754|nr:LPS export ABC transporter permease LptG [Coxiella endosymbiont of Ornithodoros amblus]MBW5802630.1 LPS export ABC transporter permease LptG [Coxiella endosymbiont of Ornithodoros amblus]
MSLLNRYICNAIIMATAVVMLVLLGVEMFMEFIGQLSQIGSVHYGLGQAFLYVLTQLPSDLYQLFPMAGFLGCLIGLGRLASSSELMIMRTAGVSIAGITWAVVKAALLMIVVMTFIGEVIAPQLEASGEETKLIALSKAIGYKALGEVWLHGAQSFIHIRSVDAKNKISGVSEFFINNKHQLLSAIYAPKGEYVKGHWILYNVKQTQFSRNRTTEKKMAKFPLTIVFNPDRLQQGRKMADRQSIVGLYHTIRYRQQAGLQTSRYVFAFWQRFIQPLTTVVMICLGVPFIFGSLHQASMGLQILTGIVVGFAFYMLNQFFGPFAMLYQIPPIFAALMPTVLFAVGCVILLRYSRR